VTSKQDMEGVEASGASKGVIRVLFIDDEFIEYRAIKKKVPELSDFAIEFDYSGSIEDAVEKLGRGRFDLILLDNRLLPRSDFRETVPELRGAGYTGPIGVVSTDISGGYFQQFPDYGVDFRIGKDEIDPSAIQHIIREYVAYETPSCWKEDYSI
jgi:DNA-binding NarL/FixJ family response regulator